MTGAPTSAPAKRGRRRRRFLLLIVVALAVAGSAWFAAGRAPAWYAPPESTDPEVQRTGQRFEHRLVSVASQVRGADDTWAVRITEAQINAWLAARLPAWLRHVGSTPPVLPPQVRLGDGVLNVAVPIGGRTLSAAIEPAIENGELRLRVRSTWIGAIPIPAGGAAQLADAAQRVLGGASNSEANRALRLLSGEPVPAHVRLGDGRLIELVRFELLPGEVVLECRTVPAGRD